MALITAAGVDDVEPIWASLLAKALEGKNVKDLLSNVGSGGGAPAVGAGPAAAAAGGAGAAAEAAPEKEEKKEEEKEESDDDMVCSLTPVAYGTHSSMLGFWPVRLISLFALFTWRAISICTEINWMKQRNQLERGTGLYTHSWSLYSCH